MCPFVCLRLGCSYRIILLASAITNQAIKARGGGCVIDLFIAILQEDAPESSRRTEEGEEAGVSYGVDCIYL